MEREPVTQGELEKFIESRPLLKRADDFADKAHYGQKRANGDPYIIHTREATRILFEECKISDEVILAAVLLHDTLEDTETTREELEREFGSEITSLVEAVSQLKSVGEKINEKSKKERDREAVEKVIGGNFIDWRVGVIKVGGDRLHNMRTLGFMPREKQIKKAEETEGYAKLAESLGMWIIKTELENLSFKFADPEGYEEYVKKLEQDGRTGKMFVDYMTSSLNMLIGRTGVNATVESQINSLSRLKDKSDDKSFEDINDVIRFILIVKNMDSETETLFQCYKLLAAVQTQFKGIEDKKRFDNSYIEPEDNGYSAIQVTIKTNYGAVQIVITSKEKEEFNNWGVVSLLRSGNKILHDHTLKIVITPTGQYKFLKLEDTGADYAYSISEQMGAQATGVSINGGEVQSISTVIPNGAQVDIKLGEDRIAPEPETINFASKKTKKIIEKQFLELEMSEKEKRGKEMVAGVIAERGLLNLYDLLRLREYSQKVVQILFLLGSKRSLPKLYRRVEQGLVTIEKLKKQLDDFGITKEKMGFTSILIEGSDNPGLLNIFTSEVEKRGGNIRRNYGESDKNKFTQHLVIENLTPEYEAVLEKSFRNDPRITKTIIV